MKRALLLLALFAAPAAADESWLASVLGPYEGPVLNAGRLQHLSTRFELDTNGHLVGHYHVDDTPPFDGELTDFQPDGDMQGTFIWHDPYGEGVVHVRFEPDHGRFFGRWGADTPLPDNVFDGFRYRPPAVS
jgi:hypothetical protein